MPQGDPSTVNDMVQKTKPRFHYAWVIFTVCFLMAGCALGFCSTPKGMYLKCVSDSLQISRTAYSVCNSIRFIATAVVNLFFGKLIAKYGARTLGAAGFTMLTASCIVNALAQDLFMLYLGGALLGLGLSWSSTTMVGYIVEKWFTSRKGTIMGIILASNGLTGAIAVQILSPMIYGPGESWRRSYWFCAALMTFIGLLVLIFLRSEPKDMGMEPLGSGKVLPKKQRGRDWSGITTEEAFRKPYFYICALCVFFTGMLLHAIGNVSAAHMEDRGISTAIITNVTSISSLVLLAAKMSTGFSYDKFGLRFTMTACNVFAVIAIVALAAVRGPVTAYTAAVFRALSLPLETIMLPLIASELFGRRSYAYIMGLLVSFNTLGYAVGGPAINLVYDLAGQDYVPAMLVLAGLMIVVCFAMQYCITAAHKIRTELEGK